MKEHQPHTGTRTSLLAYLGMNRSALIGDPKSVTRVVYTVVLRSWQTL
jgi:hypothetical protein